MEWLDWILKFIPSLSGIFLLILGGIINSKLEKRKNDYSLFNEKRHIHYAEAFKLLKRAEGHNLEIHSISQALILDDLNTEDLEEHLKQYLPRKQILIVLENWENGEYIKAKEIIKKYEENYKDKLAYNQIVLANNYCVENELYFKNDTFKIMDDYIKELFKLFNFKQAKMEITDEKKEDLMKKLNTIRILMQSDLSIDGKSKKRNKWQNFGAILAKRFGLKRL
ncbi:hypothetical protein [Bacillus pumilus]|uniref:hypothetical protein n=1 Tax=Bacillus pumilus TaxID=1408 RepID=UPI00273DE26A|nr:hypothetical protein [Bacillus pumilus]WLP58535.1 hypothetical protein Q8W18_13125 [Bacillus pumilus]